MTNNLQIRAQRRIQEVVQELEDSKKRSNKIQFIKLETPKTTKPIINQFLSRSLKKEESSLELNLKKQLLAFKKRQKSINIEPSNFDFQLSLVKPKELFTKLKAEKSYSQSNPADNRRYASLKIRNQKDFQKLDLAFDSLKFKINQKYPQSFESNHIQSQYQSESISNQDDQINYNRNFVFKNNKVNYHKFEMKSMLINLQNKIKKVNQNQLKTNRKNIQNDYEIEKIDMKIQQDYNNLNNKQYSFIDDYKDFFEQVLPSQNQAVESFYEDLKNEINNQSSNEIQQNCTNQDANFQIKKQIHIEQDISKDLEDKIQQIIQKKKIVYSNHQNQQIQNDQKSSFHNDQVHKYDKSIIKHRGGNIYKPNFKIFKEVDQYAERNKIENESLNYMNTSSIYATEIESLPQIKKVDKFDKDKSEQQYMARLLKDRLKRREDIICNKSKQLLYQVNQWEIQAEKIQNQQRLKSIMGTCQQNDENQDFKLQKLMKHLKKMTNQDD